MLQSICESHASFEKISKLASLELESEFLPTERETQLYLVIGLVVSEVMKNKKLDIVQLTPSNLSKGLKRKGFNNASRFITKTNSQQFEWLSSVLLNVFGLGVLVSCDNFIFCFVDVLKQNRISVSDIDSVLNSCSKEFLS